MANTARFDRFKDAPWFTQGQAPPVMIGGAGGIGSWLTLLLARSGFSPFVYDFDLYEEHNMGGQFCRGKDMGKSKVTSLRDSIVEYSDCRITAFHEAVTERTMTNPFVLSGFDNMEARKIMFNSWAKAYGNDPKAILLDGRLHFEQLQIYCVTGATDRVEAYAKNALFNDGEVADAACTMKQTSHSAAMIAAHMTGFFTNFMANIKDRSAGRTVPYFWEYFIPIDYLTREDV